MTQTTVEGYEQLLKQFYRKAIRTHPNRHDLITKFIKISIGMKQDKAPQLQSTHISPAKSRTTLNTLEIKQIAKSKSGSSRDNEPQSAKLSKKQKYSDEKSSHSGESDISKDKRRNRDQQKYFNCEWVYKSNSFKKTLSFALIFMYFQLNDIYNFTKLKDNIQIYFDQNPNLDNDMRKGGAQWGKLDQTFQKKDKVRWTKILPQIFINFPTNFINVLFECLTRVKSDDIKVITKDVIDSISKNLKININYFQILYQQIQKMFEKSGNYKIEINIGYIKQQDSYVFSNRVPQKSQPQKRKQKAIRNISQSIANLLRQYDANTQKLMSLDILSQSNSKQANIKNYLSKKDLK